MLNTFVDIYLHHELPTIDLHETGSVEEALEQLDRQLFLFSHEKEPVCRIIHGIGSGILAGAVHAVLSKHPLVKEWAEEITGGSCVVRISN